jgi:hypothetical protein
MCKRKLEQHNVDWNLLFMEKKKLGTSKVNFSPFHLKENTIFRAKLSSSFN